MGGLWFPKWVVYDCFTMYIMALDKKSTNIPTKTWQIDIKQHPQTYQQYLQQWDLWHSSKNSDRKSHSPSRLAQMRCTILQVLTPESHYLRCSSRLVTSRGSTGRVNSNRWNFCQRKLKIHGGIENSWWSDEPIDTALGIFRQLGKRKADRCKKPL